MGQEATQEDIAASVLAPERNKEEADDRAPPAELLTKLEGKGNGNYKWHNGTAECLVRLQEDAWNHQPATPKPGWGPPGNWPSKTTWVLPGDWWARIEYRKL